MGAGFPRQGEWWVLKVVRRGAKARRGRCVMALGHDMDGHQSGTKPKGGSIFEVGRSQMDRPDIHDDTRSVDAHVHAPWSNTKFAAPSESARVIGTIDPLSYTVSDPLPSNGRIDSTLSIIFERTPLTAVMNLHTCQAANNVQCTRLSLTEYFVARG